MGDMEGKDLHYLNYRRSHCCSYKCYLLDSLWPDFCTIDNWWHSSYMFRRVRNISRILIGHYNKIVMGNWHLICISNSDYHCRRSSSHYRYRNRLLLMVPICNISRLMRRDRSQHPAHLILGDNFPIAHNHLPLQSCESVLFCYTLQ